MYDNFKGPFQTLNIVKSNLIILCFLLVVYLNLT